MTILWALVLVLIPIVLTPVWNELLWPRVHNRCRQFCLWLKRAWEAL